MNQQYMLFRKDLPPIRYGTAPEDTFVGYQPQSPNACEWTSAIIKQVDNAKALVEQEANTAKASNEIILGAKSTHQKQATEKIKKKAKEITKIMDNLVLALNELGKYCFFILSIQFQRSSKHP